MIQIPKNRIVENQYTNGTGIGKNIALRFAKSKLPYIGFYSVINGNKYFTGKTYTDTSKPLERYNILATATAAIVAAGTVATKTHSLLDNPSVRYFYKDLTVTDISIKEIDKNAYNQLAGNNSPNYQVISYNPTIQTIDQINQQMPGLRAFLVT